MLLKRASLSECLIVTVAALLTQRITIVRGVSYLLAQIVGAIMGAAFSIGATNSSNNGNLGLVEFAPGVSDGQALCMEVRFYKLLPSLTNQYFNVFRLLVIVCAQYLHCLRGICASVLP